MTRREREPMVMARESKSHAQERESPWSWSGARESTDAHDQEKADGHDQERE